MLLKLDEPKFIVDIMSIISELVTEIKLQVDKDGMSLIAIDPANVALVSFRIPSSAFSQFETEKELIGLNLDSLKSVLKRCGPGSSLIMQTQDNSLRIEIQDKIKRNFVLALIDIEGEEKTVPPLDFTATVEIDSLDIVECIEDCSVVADSCSFVTQDNSFIIEAKGLNSSKAVFPSEMVKINAETGNIKSKYSLEYLQKFVKAARIVDKVKVQFANDYPLKIEFATPRMNLFFILAPRVETED